MEANRINVILGEVILEEQEGGYLRPSIEIRQKTAILYLDEVFEQISGKRLNEVPGYEPKLNCGKFKITIERKG